MNSNTNHQVNCPRYGWADGAQLAHHCTCAPTLAPADHKYTVTYVVNEDRTQEVRTADVEAPTEAHAVHRVRRALSRFNHRSISVLNVVQTAGPLAEYAAMVDAIGYGFHPDTPGAGYLTLPADYTPELVDSITAAAEATGADLNLLALSVLDGDR